MVEEQVNHSNFLQYFGLGRHWTCGDLVFGDREEEGTQTMYLYMAALGESSRT